MICESDNIYLIFRFFSSTNLIVSSTNGRVGCGHDISPASAAVFFLELRPSFIHESPDYRVHADGFATPSVVKATPPMGCQPKLAGHIYEQPDYKF